MFLIRQLSHYCPRSLPQFRRDAGAYLICPAPILVNNQGSYRGRSLALILLFPGRRPVCRRRSVIPKHH